MIERLFGLDEWDGWMVIIGQWSSKSTFGAKDYIELVLIYEASGVWRSPI